MNDRLFHAVSDASLKEEVLSNAVLPLVRELNHAYGLKVYVKNHHNGYNGYGMCNEEGLPIAKVFFHDDSFCYNAPYQQKSRGTDEFDRQTYRSKKLSTLMSTLKKADVITTTDKVLAHNSRRINNLIAMVSNSFEDKSKDNLHPAHAQKLLQAMVEGKDINSFSESDRGLYLNILDEYKNVDIMKEVKKKGIESMFKDCYFVLGDTNGHYIVSESTYEYAPSPYTGGSSRLEIKSTTPFKRVKHLNDYPSLLATMTMLKVNLGDEFRPFSGATSNNLFPKGDKHISDLDVVYGYERNSGSNFDMGWLCLAK
jgi:hypothetical protein